MLTWYDNIMKVNNPSWESTTQPSIYLCFTYTGTLRMSPKYPSCQGFQLATQTSNKSCLMLWITVGLVSTTFDKTCFFSKYSLPKFRGENYNNIKSKPSNKNGILEKLSTQKNPPPFGFPGFSWHQVLSPSCFCGTAPNMAAKSAVEAALGKADRGKAAKVKTWKLAALGTSGVV